MERRVTIGEYEVSIQADQSDDPSRPGYVVRYSIIRIDGRPVRGDLPKVQSYDLIEGTDYFSSIDAALDYGEEKARQDVATF
ncbi:hypothetical protein LMG31506_00191 [Cupriavidus yeoncheonensis]|uniref:Uncharacterized protein n=1 Tax=Cupriavidus yeoncheonensis TaxID=1462994 RepID=A0A916IN60_9BURK|nr:hypothetical protein [Cupriavidus yeoncheonensis]CAG2126825.1 hypothetical protein LMG31506_00191 [Cupriavidus yeoncheonensis]